MGVILDFLRGNWWKPIFDGGKWLVDQIAASQSRAEALRNAELEVKLAKAEADKELAVYKARSDIEWDLKWSDAARFSWKDEYLLLLWSAPLVGLFIPPLRPFIMEGFDYLKLYYEDAPQWYFAGWAVMIATTFGLKQALSFMMPGKITSMLEAMGKVPDDIPETAIANIDARIAKKG